MRRFWSEIDLQVVAMLLLFAPTLCLNWWLFPVPLLVPQGRICVRVFWDYPAFGQRPWAYLAANELMVGVVVAAVAGIRVAARG